MAVMSVLLLQSVPHALSDSSLMDLPVPPVSQPSTAVFSVPTLLSVSCAKVDTTLTHLLPISVSPVPLLFQAVLSADLAVSVTPVLEATS